MFLRTIYLTLQWRKFHLAEGAERAQVEARGVKAVPMRGKGNKIIVLINKNYLAA